MDKKSELKAAAARLLYNSNRGTSDYDMLIDFIDSRFDKPLQDVWIPCSKELPKKSGKYLVTQKRYSITDKEHKKPIAIETDCAEFYSYDNTWGRAKFFEVIAWLQPEPYREE